MHHEEMAARLGIPVTQVWEILDKPHVVIFTKFQQSWAKTVDLGRVLVHAHHLARDTTFTLRTFNHQHTLRHCLGQHFI